jgi:tetratricopeptide (TPR) repeat protein
LQLAESADRYSPVARSRDELDAFRAIQVETRLRSRLGLTDAFLDAYPESELRYLVLRIRWRALLDGQSDPAAIIRAASEGLEAARDFLGPRLAASGLAASPDALAVFELENLEAGYYRSMAGAAGRMADPARTSEYTEQAIAAQDAAWARYQGLVSPGTPEFASQLESHRTMHLSLLQNAMLVARDSGQVDAMLGYGARALEVDPNDLLTLMTLASALAGSSDTGPGQALRLDLGMDYAVRAVGLLEMPGEGLPAPGSVDLLRLEASARFTLGRFLYEREEYVPAVSEFERVAEIAPRDARTYYRLGLAYASAGETEPALSALAKAVYLGIEGPEVRQSLDQIYELVYGTGEGIDRFIATEGARLDAASPPGEQ